MKEKELPFKLPVAYEEVAYHQHKGKAESCLALIDANGKEILNADEKQAIANADFICLACNSYFEQRRALEEIKQKSIDGSCVQKIAKAALTKGDTNESD